ncbi:hypothetical protein IMCC3317_27760 [Kordia antarctica]|uniref:Outer membrane protein beta-barrel domain-containing protein n=1 Tax=Kordia antarctica TaxID=1218801 RepID=A0A7L4ZLM8_9FLAO|nr:hypothetical protein [Kordia antarctica]QHI37397.1 hypothetical protein IMCC3317_27760 [Kordia antarctica]
MSDQKKIDNLFRDTFEDFEASPDSALWDKISDKLDAQEAEKKRKGVIFLPWLYKAAGIAAAIALLFFVGNEFVNSDGTEIDSDEQTTETTKKDSNLDENNNGTTSNSKLTDINSEQNSSNDPNNSSSNKIINDQERIANENGVAQQNGTTTNSASQESSNNNVTTNKIKNRTLITNENAVTNTSSPENKNSTNTNQQTPNNRSNNGNYKVGNGDYVLGSTTVTQNNNNGTKTSENNNDVQNGVNSSKTNKNAVTNSNSSTVAQNDPNNSTNASNTSNSSATNATKTTDTETSIIETAVAEVKKDDLIKKSLLDVINDLHDLEKESEVAEVKRKKWTISPNASPIYYNSLSNGSPIDETFADNTKAGDVNLSYGVNVGYDVSKRLTIRSGIHKVDYSYSTQDIALVPSINGNDLTTIAFRTNGASFDLKDRQAPSTIVYSQYQLPTSESSIFEKQIEGNLNQRMSYIEVPVELKYAVLDKKLGINVIGGVSTLLLTENSIILDSPEIVAEIGEATNINDVSFSTNIGIGIDYKISEQLEFNLEPMLKYQLNTFSGNTGNFKPYSVGVYTGVSFRF